MTVIDRFEGEYAVLETDDGTVILPKKELPPEAKEGDILVLKNDSLIADKKAAAEKRRKTRIRLQKLIKEEK